MQLLSFFPLYIHSFISQIISLIICIQEPNLYQNTTSNILHQNNKSFSPIYKFHLHRNHHWRHTSKVPTTCDSRNSSPRVCSFLIFLQYFVYEDCSIMFVWDYWFVIRFEIFRLFYWIFGSLPNWWFPIINEFVFLLLCSNHLSHTFR